MMKQTAFEAHHAFWAKISIYRRVWLCTFFCRVGLLKPHWYDACALHMACINKSSGIETNKYRKKWWASTSDDDNDDDDNTSVMFRTLTLIFSYVMDHNCNPVSRFMMYPTNHSSSHGILDFFFAIRTVCLYIYNTHMYIC